MLAQFRTRFCIEAALASACGMLAVLTVFWRDWIEALTRFDPDAGNGSLEWAFVVGLALACVVFSVLARREWRRITAAAVASA
jgi:hypothetical protein